MMFEPAQLVLDVTASETRLTRDTFFEGPCNTGALAEIMAWRSWGTLPRVLTGPRGSGKTHLGSIFAQASDALMLRPSRLSAVTVPVALDAEAIVLDNAHRLAQVKFGQEIAFHVFNQAREYAQPLLILGEGPVRDWGLTLPDLSSRLTASAQIRVSNPDEPMLLMVLIKLFADRQLAVPLETVEYAVHRMERSFAAAQSLVAALDDENLRDNRRITKPMIRDTIARLSKAAILQGGPE